MLGFYPAVVAPYCSVYHCAHSFKEPKFDSCSRCTRVLDSENFKAAVNLPPKKITIIIISIIILLSAIHRCSFNMFAVQYHVKSWPCLYIVG